MMMDYIKTKPVGRIYALWDCVSLYTAKYTQLHIRLSVLWHQWRITEHSTLYTLF